MDNEIVLERFVYVEDMMVERLFALKESVESSDGIDSCIDLDSRLNFSDGLHSLMVASSNGEVVGIASIFAPRREEGEIAVCVDLPFRRKGVGTSLVHLALDELRTHRVEKALLVCDERSQGGKRFVEACNGVPLFHEYGMRLTAHVPGVVPEGFSVRLAEYGDGGKMAAICSSAYGDEYASSLAFINTSMDAVGRRGYVGLLHGRIVGMCFVGFHSDVLSLNTVAVDPAFQGMGLGKALISQVIELVSSPRLSLVLDVDSTNSKAFGLYRALGFSVEKDIAYYGVDIHFGDRI
jgi:ribosomal protein S18 acetylase RimI-like enzyme